MKNTTRALACLLLALIAVLPAFGQDGADDTDWSTYLWDAVRGNRLDLIKAYLNAGRPHTYPTGSYDGEDSILRPAFVLGNVEAARLMLDAGVTFDLGFEINRSYDWREIIEAGNPAMVKLVLSRGYSPNLQMQWRANGEDSSGTDWPLTLAARAGNAEIMSLLLAAGARPDAVYHTRFNSPTYGGTGISGAVGFSFDYRTAWDILGDRPELQALVKKYGGTSVSKDPRFGETATISGAGLRVRSSPGTDGTVLGKLEAGVKVRALRTGPEDTVGGFTALWIYVVAPGGLEGWVFGQFLSW